MASIAGYEFYIITQGHVSINVFSRKKRFSRIVFQTQVKRGFAFVCKYDNK